MFMTGRFFLGGAIALLLAAAGQKPAGPAQAKELGAAVPPAGALTTAIEALKETPADKSLYLQTLELLPEYSSVADSAIGPRQASVTVADSAIGPRPPKADSVTPPPASGPIGPAKVGQAGGGVTVADSAIGPRPPKADSVTEQISAFKTITAVALEKEKTYYGYYLGLCKLQRIGGKIKEALANCRKALELDATPYAVYRELGLTWAQAGNEAKAEEILSQGVELSSHSYKAYLNRAGVREKFGETQTALADYLKAMSLLKKKQTADFRLDAAIINARIKKLSSQKKLRTTRTPAPHFGPFGKSAGQAGVAEGSVAKASYADPEKCVRDFRLELASGSFETAERSSAECLKHRPSDPELRKDHAALLVRLGRYEDAVAQYNRAAELYKKQPMAAFCRVKTAETLTKLGRGSDAEKAYKAALETSPGDLNAMRGLAKIFEIRGDLKSASGIYKKILSADPSNAEARTRLSVIEAELILPEQAFAELKERQAVDPKKFSAGPEDLKLFRDITAAERNGAVDYLKRQHHSLNGLILERPDVNGPKLLLTGAGYRLYLSYLSREAVAFFEGKSITLGDVFALRDNSGNPLFDKAGKLTAEGAAALRLAQSGQKSWLLTYEPIPLSPDSLKADKEIEAARGRGYGEISEPEYLWLLRATNCPEDVLLADPLNARRINDGARARYLICYAGGSPCMNNLNKSLVSSIEAYRSGQTEISDSRTSTAFFGTGAVNKRRLCENGKIWMGEQ
ncbi:MAG: hypothetical protein A2X33_09150 [Elusimicrobia bacterium GWA2_51_34]|nr:MAG: hypothetical protein A2X33_09150 [Elusimicrobia bacterium GWA2_51_34]